MPTLRHLVLALSAAGSITLGGPTARAAPAGAEAETLFREGKRLMADGKIAEACAAFEASQRLDPTVSTLLNAAACREKNKQLATAWGLFLEAERQTRAATDETTKRLHKVALDHAAKLEPRISKLTINIAADVRTDRLEILRGSDQVPEVEWSRAIPVDGGSYPITARAPGKADWSTTVTVGMESDAQTVDVPKLESLPATPPVSAPPPAPVAAAAPPSALALSAPPPAPASLPSPAPRVADLTTAPAPPASAQRPSRTGAVLFGVGALAALGGAVAFKLWGDATYNQSKMEPDWAKQDSLYNSANAKLYVAEGLAGAGAVSAVVSLWLALRGPGGDRAAPAASAGPVAVAPFVGGGQAGLGLVATY